jgi:23S rRNA pseudouridine1911/1915/1917 synthase
MSENFIVEEAEVGQRLDVLAARRAAVTRSHVERMIKEGSVRVNGASSKSGYRLRLGDTVEVEAVPPPPSTLTPEAVELNVVYEDPHLIVVDKPPAMVMYPSAGHPGGTLLNAIAHRAEKLAGAGGPLRPGVVHRIDKDTSGLVVVALDDAAYYGLVTQFSERTIRRKYLALVYGKMKEEEGEIALSIGRSSSDRKMMSTRSKRSRPALTSWRVIEEFRAISLVEAVLYTGRTHQIRVHFSALNHPVIGDAVYGSKTSVATMRGTVAVGRQMLHAASLGFTHPISGLALDFKAPLPTDMAELIERLRQRVR